MRDVDLTSADLTKLKTTKELMEREWAPCRYNCPVHADVRAYIEMVARGQFQLAIDIIRERLPFASVCGRICHHPCEANCRRHEVDEPVAIREVKRFVSELQGADGATVHKAVQNKAAVAVVGAGPAGLACGLDLAKLGYRPTVFEKFSSAGGIPASAIPLFRLPRKVLQQDIDWIAAHGVTIRTGVDIGKDKTISDLRKEGFAAVVVAAGLSQSRMLPLPGADHAMVYPVLKFLTDAAAGKSPAVGRNVLVIGGGNVAMDAARTALRLGAPAVTCMCLETFEEMPAFAWEKREAQEEGVKFVHRRGPVEVVVQSGKITGVKARKVLRVFDESKRFSPTYQDSDLIEIACDTVIMAIGQAPDMGFLQGSDLKLDERKRLVCNFDTQQTSNPAVFACGEIVTAPGSVVEACASGQRAAAAVDLFLRGEAIQLASPLPPAIDKIDPKTAEKVQKVPRTAVAAEDPEKRKRLFEEVDHNLDTYQAMWEARRCMGCGSGAEVLVDKCTACLTCLRVCPFDIPKVTDVARINSALCQACGMCIAECPGNAIVARGWDVRELLRQTAKELASMNGARPRIVAYVSGHHSPLAAWSQSEDERIAGVAEIYLPSVSRLSATEMLHAFEHGADGVIVVSDEVGADRYPTAPQRIAKRVEAARKLLADIGMNPQKVQLATVANRGRAAMRQAMADCARQIAEAIAPAQQEKSS